MMKNSMNSQSTLAVQVLSTSSVMTASAHHIILYMVKATTAIPALPIITFLPVTSPSLSTVYMVLHIMATSQFRNETQTAYLLILIQIYETYYY